MALLRKLTKLALLALAAAVIGAIAVSIVARRKSAAASDVTIDEWPDVPQKPAA